ncbi:MAG: chemotaxis protein CheR, partial [Candidatus Omnitrophica bacterium]|nr:chemotaxis protein CheR [Candidatus Omnitrophota bacterium]MBU1996697.1 chemotaxis protein CheR [Candidatus Omnitrophota bacterium]
EELGFNNNWIINLLATDVSTKSIETAKAGNYQLDQIKNVDPKIVYKYFDRKNDANKDHYTIKEILKCFVSFKSFNLVTAPFNFEKKFDFIFCRNVLIYFDRNNQQDLEFKLINALNKEGYLFFGDSESLSIENSCFMKHLGQSIYQKL